MAQPKMADRVQETTATTGTGTYTLAGAKTGFRSFTSAFSNSDTVFYAATDGTDWEVGFGVFTTSGTTLTRGTILASSNAGAAVSWAAGSKDIWCNAPALGLAQSRILIQEQQTAGTDAGSASATTWNVRALNTEVEDDGGFASVASSTVTLAAGTYNITAWAMGGPVNAHKLRWRNTTDGSTAVVGGNTYNGSANTQHSTTSMYGQFTITASKDFQLQHYTQSSLATTGLGRAANAGEVEVYSQVLLEKVA